MHRYRTIVVDTDGSEASDIAVEAAASIAAIASAQLILVCAYTAMRGEVDAMADILKRDAHLIRGSYPADDILRSAAENAAACGAIDVVRRAVPGSPVNALLSIAAETDADLVVVTRRGPNSAVARRLGTLPDELARRSRVAVLAVCPAPRRTLLPRRGEPPTREVSTGTGLGTFLRSRLLPRSSSQPVS
ncbi:universal stress protein [Nocardia amamiensis]|uniref:universal stress protein n=1 Tax=Nocardia amamiensis TaxID=404578 RepID=UPI00082BC092|nr:universal stress protein [Nocardia amamiensis]